MVFESHITPALSIRRLGQILSPDTGRALVNQVVVLWGKSISCTIFLCFSWMSVWSTDFMLFDDVIVYSLVYWFQLISLFQTIGIGGWYHCSGRRWSRAALLCRLCRQRTSMLQHRLPTVTSPNHKFVLSSLKPHRRLQQGNWTEPLYRQWQVCWTIPQCRLYWV